MIKAGYTTGFFSNQEVELAQQHISHKFTIRPILQTKNREQKKRKGKVKKPANPYELGFIVTNMDRKICTLRKSEMIESTDIFSRKMISTLQERRVTER